MKGKTKMESTSLTNSGQENKPAATGKGRKRRPAPPHFRHAKHLLSAMYVRGEGRSKKETRLSHKKSKRHQQEKEYIFSTTTLKVYTRQVYYYFRWIEDQGITLKNFQQSSEYVQQYLDWMSDRGLSPYSIKLAGCAILKLFPGKYLGQYDSPSRSRGDITKGRGHDLKYFLSLRKNHPELYMFGLATGLRKKKELAAVRGSFLVEKEGKYYIHIKGKNGLVRDAPIIGDRETVSKIVNMMKEAGEEKLFAESGVYGKIPWGFDEHTLRSIYAVRIYLAHERPMDTLAKEEKYYCAGDYIGIALDKRAMKIASEALGHHRLNVIASSYLWPMVTMDPEIQAYFGIASRTPRERKKKVDHKGSA